VLILWKKDKLETGQAGNGTSWKKDKLEKNMHGTLLFKLFFYNISNWIWTRDRFARTRYVFINAMYVNMKHLYYAITKNIPKQKSTCGEIMLRKQ
jgi:hypothetical protein